MQRLRGMTLIDVVVGTAIIALVFIAIVGVARASLAVASTAKAKAAAQSIAQNEMEYIRGLTYASVGTVGGIPSGVVPQTQTQVLDGISYTVRTLVEYVDDPGDGLGVNDSNGITIDYKQVKVQVSYALRGQSKSLAIVSNFAPPGLESTNGGGTLQVKVVNAVGAAVPGASVQVFNASTSPAVNLTTYANSSGIVNLPGAATSTGYQVTVSNLGYSTAQTYQRTVTNQNPTPGYLTVATNQTTTGTFAIDALGSLTIQTYAATTTLPATSTPLKNIPFTLTGAKTIGSTGTGAPIYKTVVAGNTGASASVTLPLEWDSYTPSISGYDVTDFCSTPPYVLAPGSATTVGIILGSHTTNSLLVEVEDSTGSPVSGATVTLSRSGYTSTVSSSLCGNAYFGSIASSASYSVQIAKTGYTTKTFTSVSVSGTSTYVVAFP